MRSVGLTLSIIDPQYILKYSSGKLISDKTFHYRDSQPYQGGLFCPHIFIGKHEYQCACGLVTGESYLHILCNNCNTVVSKSKRTRIGHIILRSPIVHPWFYREGLITGFFPSHLHSLESKFLREFQFLTRNVFKDVIPSSIDLHNLIPIESESAYTYLKNMNLITELSKVDAEIFRLRVHLALDTKYRRIGYQLLRMYKDVLRIDTVRKKLITNNTVSLLKVLENICQRKILLCKNIKTRSEQKKILYTFLKANMKKELHYLVTKQKLLLSFILSEQRPEWMFLTVMPILPIDLRPIIKLEGDLFVSSDVNYLYKAILRAHFRYTSFMNRRFGIRSQYDKKHVLYDKKMHYPKWWSKAKFYASEKRILNECIWSLLDSYRDPSTMTYKFVKEYQALISRWSGKEGRFRSNLLGKRTNYSGRSVIVSGPRMSLNQCGLPILTVYNLLKPFIESQLNVVSKKVKSKHQKKLIRRIQWVHLFGYRSLLSSVLYSPFIKILNSIVQKHPILLNRAPTLHRLNIQAFYPIVVRTKAINLHPLVCTSFNADFDGDTMAIHIPYTLPSQVEARMLMFASNNLMNPASSEILIAPSQDVIFGLYYSTICTSNVAGEYTYYKTASEVKTCLELGVLHLHAKIYYKLPINSSYVVTTPGRVLLYQLLSSISANISFEEINKNFNKKDISLLLKSLYRSSKQHLASILNQIMSFGFYFAHKGGVTVHKDDINVPSTKYLLIARNTSAHLTTNLKLYVKRWSKVTELLTKNISNDIVYTRPEKRPSIYMLIHSGARGSMVQMRQLSGMRGLMVKPSGEILNMPIQSNFKEGLTVLEYFNSIHGARKGVIDTALKTATAGYFTRKLVNAAKHVWVVEDDCGTHHGIVLGDLQYKYNKSWIYYFLIGRYLARKVINVYSGQELFNRNHLIGAQDIPTITKNSSEFYIVRSPLTCQTPFHRGVCKKCYGFQFAYDQSTSIGDPVGIIAGQSIGEPGTQLTMRTFHIGGTTSAKAQDYCIKSITSGRVLILNLKLTSNQKFASNRRSKLLVLDTNGTILQTESIPYGAYLFIEDGQFVDSNTPLFRYQPEYTNVLNRTDGYLYLQKNNLEKNYDVDSGLEYYQYNNKHKLNKTYLKSSTLLEYSNQPNSITKKLVALWVYGKDKNLIDSNQIHKLYKLAKHSNQEDFCLFNGDVLDSHSGKRVVDGTVLGHVSNTTGGLGDITDGLSKVTKIFGLVDIHSYISSKLEGVIRFDSNGYSINEKNKYRYPKGKTYLIRNLEYLYPGDVLSTGLPATRQLLQQVSFFAGMQDFVQEIISIYGENGVQMNQKHLEVILRQIFSITKNNNTLTHYYIHTITNLSKGRAIEYNLLSAVNITNAAIIGTSFLASASFQKPALVLTHSFLLTHKPINIDLMTGTQPQFFMGLLMPAGTSKMYIKKIFNK
uniref:DNA-directed RNA polymerase subunit n=1 Tax=Seculamonas ecuadoriensis TaxID=221724 RepID=M4QM92_SECEC|nr:RNA polymerase subunit beta' [Seculamonas ecuadoriensis]AGH24483.1 RNA polymerase subunit beta' [Seculamonas ecuadoriensis]